MKPLDGEPIESWTRQRSHGGPIDYERRRRLDYSTPLTEGSWPKAAADTANTLRRHARQHHIGDAQRQAHNQTSIDLDWLHREYVINNRTLSDMAREIGMATSSLRRQAVKHGIGASMREHPIGMSIGTLSAEVVGVDDERDDGKATAGWAETPA